MLFAVAKLLVIDVAVVVVVVVVAVVVRVVVVVVGDFTHSSSILWTKFTHGVPLAQLAELLMYIVGYKLYQMA